MRNTLHEQPEDWTEPGAHPVVPGVHRIPLALPIPALHSVNVYVIEGPDGITVVDSGFALPDIAETLSAGLAPLGYGPADVREYLVTHAHWDHYSQALLLRETFRTPVRVGRGELPSIEHFGNASGPHERQAERLRRCGAGAIADELLAQDIAAGDGPPFDVYPDSWMDDGESVRAGERNLDVFATPGHTRGHVVLRDAPAGLLFAGDHVLPHITPSIGLEGEPEAMPLRSYLESLRLVREMPDTLLLPAHGRVTPSVHVRIDELLQHHRERLDRSAEAVKAGHTSSGEVAAALRWTRRQQRLDELEVFSQMLAVLEIEAHLDVLVDQGILDMADDAEGIRRYAQRA